MRAVGKRGRFGCRYLSDIDHDSLAGRGDHPRSLRLWGKKQIMKESYGSIKKKANGAKSILSCKTLEVIITFAGRTGNLGNLGRGLGSLE